MTEIPLLAMPALEAVGLTKRYGRQTALSDCTLDIPSGRVVGLVGPNGAGKTTSLSMAVGLLRPDDGHVRIFGRDVWSDPVGAKTLIGVLPGIGPALTIALLLPITFNFEDPVGAFILFAGIYAGGMYGGSTTSILLNTPGESASVATAIEGYQMAKRGRGGPALATSAIGSFVAGTIGILLLTFLAEPVANVAVQLQPPDYFALTVLAFVSVTALVGSSLIRGMLSLFIGLFIGLIGIDEVSGTSRLTFGVNELNNGVDIVLVGEMRDLETIAIAIETAETGHLVFGTLHTTTAPSTVDRIIDQFPSDQQAQIRVMLSESLKGVIAQTLLRTVDGKRAAAHETRKKNEREE